MYYTVVLGGDDVPKGNPTEGIPRGIRFPTELIPKIDEVRKRYKNTFSGAVIYLVELGIRKEDEAETNRRIGEEVNKPERSADDVAFRRRPVK